MNLTDVNVLEGRLQADNLRIGIVAARFNELVVERLVASAIDAFRRAGGAPNALSLAWVPGAFEAPVCAKVMAQSGHYDAVVALGAVIRGATPHFDYVAGQAAAGIMHAGLATSVPVVFGVLTCDSVEQAMDRAGLKAGNKGGDAMRAAIETAQLLHQLGAQPKTTHHAATR